MPTILIALLSVVTCCVVLRILTGIDKPTTIICVASGVVMLGLLASGVWTSMEVVLLLP